MKRGAHSVDVLNVDGVSQCLTPNPVPEKRGESGLPQPLQSIAHQVQRVPT